MLSRGQRLHEENSRAQARRGECSEDEDESLYRENGKERARGWQIVNSPLQSFPLPCSRAKRLFLGRSIARERLVAGRSV